MIIGIDLGTTNSLVAIWRDGKAAIIPNALGEHLTPSCVSIDDDGTVLVGRAARERLQTHPQLTAAVFKRYMGSEKKITLGTQQFRPEELSSMVLRALTAIMIPEALNPKKIVKTMRDVHGITFAGGQGDLDGKVVRIAHMGAVDEYDILTGLSCLEKVLKEAGRPWPQKGLSRHAASATGPGLRRQRCRRQGWHGPAPGQQDPCGGPRWFQRARKFFCAAKGRCAR